MPDTLVRYFSNSLGCASYKRPASSSRGPVSEKRLAGEPFPYPFDPEYRVVTSPRYRRPCISLSARGASDPGTLI